FSSFVAHRHLLYFSTRRSSDLNNLEITKVLTAGINTIVIPVIIPGILKGKIILVNTFIFPAPKSSAASIRLLSIFINTEYIGNRSEEHTSELQSRENLVCRLLL